MKNAKHPAQKSILFLLSCLLTFSLACATLLPEPTATPEPTPTQTPEPTATPIPSATPAPTETPVPPPTDTPVPTETAVPEPTATPEVVASPTATSADPRPTRAEGTETLPTPSAEGYFDPFDSVGDWATGNEDEIVADVVDGVYRFNLIAPDSFYWTTAGQDLGDGFYGVTATAVAGPLNNGFGLMFMVDDSSDTFYALEISSDGYIDIYYCADACETYIPLVGDGWFTSSAVNQGLNAPNTLLVQVIDGEMIFYVNDEEVGQAQDRTLSSGNIGLLVETFDEGDVVVEFDDFIHLPLGSTP